MKFGILYWTPHTEDYPVDRQLQEVVELARATRDAGFDTFASNHGYLRTPLRALQPVPLLARLAPETGDMALLTGVFLLALHNPIEVAEQMATLDVISGGRLVFGVGVGGRTMPCEAFGFDPAHRGARTGESLRIITRLWTEDRVTYNGRHFSVADAVCITKPLRKPRPPIWIGATEDAAIRRAARLADAWYPSPHAPLAHTERGLAYYREYLREYGKTAPPELPIRRDLFIAADQDTAVREGSQSIRGPMSLWHDTEYDPDRYFMGSPEAIVEEIGRYRERLGDLHWIFRITWPGLPQKKVLEQVELLASKVIPHFR
jgi:alkanesulfonate monooxygenase SsuD/methylene tetrahydromethanopterin reductase-like flavin-dependent oxidoreductase (luciferase family)